MAAEHLSELSEEGQGSVLGPRAGACCDVRAAGAVVRIVRDVSEWEGLEREWTELFEASPTASPPLQFDWLRQWWQVYGPTYGDQGRGLRVLTVWRGERLIGALPLYEGRNGGRIFGARRLAFLSTGEAEFEETCAEYLDLLHLPGEQRCCLDAIRAALLASDELRWEELELCDVSEHTPLLRWQHDFRDVCRTTVTARGVCPIANLSGGFEAYLGQLSPNTRQQSRRLLRQAERHGAVLELAADAADASKFFQELIRLHQERWTAAGKPGCFAARPFTEFHRQLVGLWVPNGKAVLARLSVGRESLAVIYGFVAGAKFDFYQSGARLDGGLLQSPGNVAHLMLMRELAERGVTRYDFLRGSQSYKQRLATEECALVRLHIGRPSLLNEAGLMADLLRRASLRGLRLLFGGKLCVAPLVS